MYEQRACFFAWLIMPFNSTSTMPLHHIISQWSGLFLLSHALSFFFSPFIAKWIMDPTMFTRGRAASWRTGWPIVSFRGRRADGGSLLFCTHRRTRRLPVWAFLVMVKRTVAAHQRDRCVCLWELQHQPWCQVGPWLLCSSQPGRPSVSLLTVPG